MVVENGGARAAVRGRDVSWAPPRRAIICAMRSNGWSWILLTGATTWAGWVVSQYYNVPLPRPEIADGVLGGSFPYWTDAARHALASLAGASVTLLAAWGFGHLSFRLLNHVFAERADAAAFFEHFIERVTFELACGFLCLSSLCLGLALLHVYHRPAVHALLTSGVVVAVASLLRRRDQLPRHIEFRRPSARTILFGACIVCALGFALVGALAPEIEYDALWYHLWLPKRWLDVGAPVDILGEYVSLYPLSWELLYGTAMTVGGAGAAKLLHFVCLPLLGGASWLLSRSLFPRTSGMLAAALAVVSPTMIWEATTAYSDLALALFLTLSIHALIRSGSTGNRRWLVLGALMMGAALATKHLALLALAAMTIALVARQLATKAAWRPALRTATLFAVISMAVPGPWYLRAYSASGNPVFPDLYGVFGAQPPERWSPTTEDGLRRFKSRFGRPRTLKNMALLPWDVSVHSARYGGTFGPIFLMFIPLAFAGERVPRTARLVAAGAAIYVALWASAISSFQLRFLIPLVPVFAAFASAGIAHAGTLAARLHPTLARLVPVPVALVLFLNLPPFTAAHERDRDNGNGWLTHVMRAAPARVVLGAIPIEAYLRAMVPSYAAWSFIDGTLPPGSRILTFSGGDHLYSAHERLWSDATSARPMTWGAASGHEGDVVRTANRVGITHVLFDKRQIADGLLANLAIASEKMRTCCLTPVWEDSRFELDRLTVPLH